LYDIFDEDLVAVIPDVEGVGVAFSKKPWDHLLFTGSTAVGRHVMGAAADNLTPVTLELGGKSPAIISPDVPMKDAAERIAFGKVFNAGQTCVAPDYVLCPRDRKDEFVSAFGDAFGAMYRNLENNPHLTGIVNDRQYNRLQDLRTDALVKGAREVKINPADESFENTRKMPISLLLDVTDDMTVMQEEIFGPLLPVVLYDTFKDALAFVNNRPRPLALYLFDYNKERAEHTLSHTHSGGAIINDTLSHVAQDDLPFGGVGPSGMGEYHGREGFMTFSKAKGVLYKPRFNSAKLIYPPYGRLIHRLIYKLFIR
jgi:coniferyl-aldehyde dehydrogenase